MNFSTIRSEGSLLSAALLAQTQSGEAEGQKSANSGLDSKIRTSFLKKDSEFFQKIRVVVGLRIN